MPVSEEIVTEIAPFTHKLKQGGEEVKPDGMAYLPVIWDKIFEVLDQYSRYGGVKVKKSYVSFHYFSNRDLIWHDGIIPDRGQRRHHLQDYMQCLASKFQTEYLPFFCIFLAYDSPTNLHISLDRYADQIKDLQGMKWSAHHNTWSHVNIQRQDKFIVGDYELLCKIYGITGATGTTIINIATIITL